MSIRYRPLNSEDAATYRQIRLRALREAPSAFSSSYEEQKAEPIEFFRDRVNSTPERFINGAFDEARLIGTLGFYRETVVKRSHIGTIVGMFVEEAYRGKGISKTLLNMVINRAGQVPGLQHLLVAVSVDALPALYLYEQAGFAPWGREPNAIKIGQEFIDTYTMILYLKDYTG